MIDIGDTTAGGVVVLGIVILYKTIVAPLIEKVTKNGKSVGVCPSVECTSMLHKLCEAVVLIAESLKVQTSILTNVVHKLDSVVTDVEVLKDRRDS